MEDKDRDEEQDSPEQKESKIEKQYNEQMAFLVRILGSETVITTRVVASQDVVANAVAKVFKEREEKLADEVYLGLAGVLDTHMKAELAIKEQEKKLVETKLAQRKEFVKVMKLWRSKIDQQAINKETYVETLK